jgi:L-aspartate oxidase
MEGAPRFLMSEALRGEGAWLVNARGERFMGRYHKGLELAPRDVVARAIAKEAMDGPVYLDMRKSGEQGTGNREQVDLKERFPGISKFLDGCGLELARDLIPVRPAAHYLMGGIRTDVHGRTSVAGLFAAGEVACTGVHGANRLASNSLLEGLVFGALAAEEMIREQGPGTREQGTGEHETGDGEQGSEKTKSQATEASGDVEEWIAELRALMWRDVGLLRDGVGLRRAQAELEAMRERMPRGLTRRALEARNLHTVAEVMVQVALAREESRGAHYRTDFPEAAEVARHSVAGRGGRRFAAP